MGCVKLSVVMPVHNAAETLRETVASVLGQSLADLELICVDDGSTDDSLAILRDLAAHDERMQVLTQENLHAGPARNKGLDVASGEYVHFLDADDSVLPFAYECVVRKMEKQGLDMLRFASVDYDVEQGVYVDNPRNSLSGLRPGDFMRLVGAEKDSPLYKVGVTPWAGIYRRGLLIERGIRFNDLVCCNDRSFFIAALTNAERVMISRDRVVAHLVGQSGSLVGARARNFACQTRSIQIVADRLVADGVDEEVQERVLSGEFTDLLVWFKRFCADWAAERTAEKAAAQLVPEAAAKGSSERVTAGEPASESAAEDAVASEQDLVDVVARAVWEETERFVAGYVGPFAHLLRQRYREAVAQMEKGRAAVSAPKETRPYHAACEHPKVSVVVPTYNVEDYLNEALHSLAAQTLEEMEFLLVNDGSTDGSMAIMRAYAAFDERFRILDGPNGGYGRAMNRGIDAARGEYLGILEPDDFVPQEMFKELYDVAMTNGAELVKADFYRFAVRADGSLSKRLFKLTSDRSYYGRVLRPLDEPEAFGFVMNTWSGVYSLDFLRRWNIRHNETPGASYQDNGFWFQTFCRAERALFVNKPYYLNRRDNPNSSMFSTGKMYCVTEEYRFIQDWLNRDEQLWEQVRTIFYSKKLSNFFVTLYRLAPQLQLEYLHHLRDEFEGPFEQGLLDETLVGTSNWARFQDIMADPDAYHAHVCVSVVMPVYNAEDYLGEALGRLLSRNEVQFEVICVDDGSTDGSLAILREYEGRDPRVRVIAQENAGAGAARNNGMRLARGEYLSFLDADDLFEPDMLSRAYWRAHADELDVVVFRSDQYIQETGKYVATSWTVKGNLLPKERPFAGSEVPSDVFKVFAGWTWDKLFRTEFVRDLGIRFQEQRTTNDMLFVFSALVKAQRIDVMNSTLVHRRMHSGSLSVTREKSWSCFYAALCALRAQLREWGLYERYEQDFINYSLHFTLWNLNSLQGATYYELYDKLKDEWLADLGLISHGMGYFYNRYEYQQLQHLLSCTAEEFLFWRRDSLSAEKDDYQRSLSSARSQLNEQKKKLEGANKTLRKDLDKQKAEVKRLRGSTTWKVGRVVTWPARKLKRLVKRLAKRLAASGTSAK